MNPGKSLAIDSNNIPLFAIYHTEVPDWLSAFCANSAMQRLKGVGMNCGLEYTSYPGYAQAGPYTRYHHSIGVALIVWHFTHDRVQSIAGLFHDCATPVFSHVIDFLHGDYRRQESTEARTGEIIRQDEKIMDGLKQAGIRVEQVEDYHLYGVADNEAPRLSADRLEYTLGNFLNYHVCSLDDCARFYRDLTIEINESGQPELSFQDPKTAREFTLLALVNARLYTSDPDRYAMEILARLLRKAIDRGVLSEKDLWTTEPVVIERLRSDPVSRMDWERFCQLHVIERDPHGKEKDGWIFVDAKRRIIDPLVKGKRVSVLYPDVMEQLRSFKEQSFAYGLRGY